MIKKYNKEIIITLIVFLNFAGIEYELLDISTTKIFVGNFWNILGVYIFPILSTTIIYALIYRLNKSIGLKKEILAIFFLSSIFSTGFIASFLNEITDYLAELITTSDLQFDWLSATFYSLIEENIKLVLVILMTTLLNSKDLKKGLIIGLVVGLGFQFCEDISYNFGSANEKEIFSTAISRLSGTLSSHWLLTGIYAYGFMGYKNLKNKKYLLYLLAPLILHMLWDSPVNDFYIVTAIISTITVLIFIKILHEEIGKNILNI